MRKNRAAANVATARICCTKNKRIPTIHSIRLRDSAERISLVSMEQVNQAVASIADSAMETAEASTEVTETMSEVADMVQNVSSMANDQQNVSQGLDDIVKQFTL